MPPRRSKKKQRSHEEEDDEEQEAPENPPKNTPVSINVGGTKYQVSRSLLDQHPDTMLTRMASETWQANPQDTLFVERDGDRFRYVLDYMRDGKVSLPGGTQGGVTKTSLLNELVYYGFTAVNPDSITVEFACIDAPKYAARLTEDFNSELKNLTMERDQKNLEIACLTVAHACCLRKMSNDGGTATVEFITARYNGNGYSSRMEALPVQDNRLAYQVVDAVNKTSLGYNAASLNNALSKFGLRMSNYTEHQGRIVVNHNEENRIYRVSLNVYSEFDQKEDF